MLMVFTAQRDGYFYFIHSFNTQTFLAQMAQIRGKTLAILEESHTEIVQKKSQ